MPTGYGCGDRGQEVVDGLTLFLRLGDDPVLTSSLAIRMSEQGLRSIELELGAPRNDTWPRRDLSAAGVVQIADQQLIVIVVAFQRLRHGGDLVYYLIYDDTDASLSMIKLLPDHHEIACTPAPLPRRNAAGGGYELVVMARNLRATVDRRDVLCVCAPETRASPAASDGGVGPWQIHGRRFPENLPPFSADVVFSFEGKAFWVDLSQGLVCCDLHNTRGSAVDFRFIRLPAEEPQLDDSEETPNDEPKKIRTVGCVGDSIRFVRVDRSRDCADDLETVWTLDLAEEKWTKEEELAAKVLWGLDGFKEAGLPEAPLEYPILTADGALCFVLPDQREFVEDGPVDDCICSFDVRRKRLLWHGRVHDYQTTEPVILLSDIFRKQHFPRKRKLAEDLPAAGLTMAGS
uniref:DUF1618 domain-containing protein n=1 Tax=Arundo donax TaxID=35708 RepID=A0A0A9DK88_ARUDO